MPARLSHLNKYSVHTRVFQMPDSTPASTLQNEELLHDLIWNSQVRCCVPRAACLELARLYG